MMAKEETLKNGTLRPCVALNPRSLLQAMKDDCLSLLPTNFLSKDFEYLDKRYQSEGDAFICVTLPTLGKALEVCLATGDQFEVPAGWRLKKNSRLPVIFNDYFKRIISDDGFPIEPEHQSHVAVLLLRQVLMFWSKRTSDTMENSDLVIDEFLKRITVDRHSLFGSFTNDRRVRNALCKAKALLHNVFDRSLPGNVNLRDFKRNPWGRHGPGAVANKESAAEKWLFDRIPYIPSKLFRWCNELVVYKSNIPMPISRITCVPKDFRGPRIICIEPKEMQFGQQGLMDLIVHRVTNHYLTRKSINFFNVERSQRLCFNTKFATIDLKDASDLISLELVKFLFPAWFYKLIVQYRTPLVNGHVSTCFATMGSALCFPIQTLVFWALALGTIKEFNRKNISYSGSTSLRVFGDDIIVPVWVAKRVCEVLTACKLKVNTSKTCIRSFVRESCGEWVYNGFSCRVSKPKVSKISSYAEWSAVVDTAQAMNERCFCSTAKLLQNSAFDFYRPITRWGKNLQRLEVRVPTVVGGRSPQLTGYAGLYAWHIGNNTSPFSRGTRLRVKWRWVTYESKYSNLDGSDTIQDANLKSM